MTAWAWVKYKRAEGQKVFPQLGCGEKKEAISLLRIEGWSGWYSYSVLGYTTTSSSTLSCEVSICLLFVCLLVCLKRTIQLPALVWCFSDPILTTVFFYHFLEFPF